jgi:uncharacterized phage-associated protein
MARVQDVAAYILAKQGSMTAMKLQKLCYYSQAWHLVWEERPLFNSEIQAWANGPVIPDLYRLHRGRFSLQPGDIAGNPKALDQAEQGSVDAVIDFYGKMDAHSLSELTHREAPWADARSNAGLEPMERGDAVISQASMAEFYDSLTHSEDSTE